MKKGIVMEKHRQYTIIMTKEGTFHKAILFEDAMIGAEVFYKPLESKKKAIFLFSPRKMNVPVRILSMVCILLLFALPFYFIMGKNNTYAYVNIDINPSIELEINDTLNVQSIRALNDDASMIVKQLENYENEELEKVIGNIMDKSEETGLINDSKNMLVGVSYSTDDKKKISVLDSLERFFNKNKEWEIAAFNVPKNVREKAEEKNKPMNEVMATTIIEKEKTDKKTSKENNSMNDEDRAIINSYYNTDKNHSEEKNSEKKTLEITPKKAKENENTSIIKEKSKIEKAKKDIPESKKVKEKPHPSELKGKNGEINSKGKNKANKNHNKKSSMNKNDGKNKAEKQKRHKQKDNKGNWKDKDKHYKDNNGKGKDKHKNKTNRKSNKHKHKYDHGKHKNNGNGNNKHNNGRSHH